MKAVRRGEADGLMGGEAGEMNEGNALTPQGQRVDGRKESVCMCVCASPQQHLFFFHDAAVFRLHSHHWASLWDSRAGFFFFFAIPPFCLAPGVLQAALQFASQQHTLLHKHKRPGITVSPGEDVASSRTWSRAGDAAEGVNRANHWDPCQKTSEV